MEHAKGSNDNAAAEAAFREALDFAAAALEVNSTLNEYQVELCGFDCFVERMKYRLGEETALSIMTHYLNAEKGVYNVK